jgi:hypothetical protein
MSLPASTLPDTGRTRRQAAALGQPRILLHFRRALLRERHLATFAALLGLVLLCLLALPVLTGRVSVFFDLGCFHLPVRDFYAHCLKTGQPFDWMPGMYRGVFITGEGEHGPYHPLHLLLYRLLPLGVAFALEAFLCYPVMFLGTFVWLRRHAGRAGALLAALVYTFCANNLSHGQHVNHVGVLAHLPWLLWLLERIAGATGRPRWRAAAGVGLLTGSQLLLGHPQAMSYSLLAEALYGLFLVREARLAVRATLAWLLGKALGLAVGGVQLLATLAFLHTSNRGSFDPLFGGYLPSRLLQILVPNLLCGHLESWCHEPAYFGAVPVVVLLWWWTARRAAPPAGWACDPARRCLTRFAVVLGLLAAWLALGKYGGLYVLQTRLPLVGQLRCAARYLHLVSFAAAVLAALGFARLAAWVRAGGVVRWRHLGLPWLAVGVTIVAGFTFQATHPRTDPAGFDRRFLSGMVVMAAAAAALTLACRGRPLGLYALVAVAALDLHHFCLENPVWGEHLWKRTTTLEAWRAAIPSPPGPGEGRVLCLAWNPNCFLLRGVRLVNGYRGGIEPGSRLDYTQVSALRLAGASWYREATFDPVLTIPGLEAAGGGWFRVPDPLPRVRLVSQALASDDPAQELANVDLAATALTTHEIPLDHGPAGHAALVVDDPGRLRVETEVSGRRLLVVSESFDPGWQASIDGASAAVERVNGDFLGCEVGPGRHVVDFTFRPAALRAGRWLSGLGLVACLLLGACTLLPRRPSRARRSRPSRARSAAE